VLWALFHGVHLQLQPQNTHITRTLLVVASLFAACSHPSAAALLIGSW
jgi:hypothetical protein